jgi:regulator of nucleoside diphosphate kinase
MQSGIYITFYKLLIMTNMKPIPVFCKKDYQFLRELISKSKNDINAKEAGLLSQELDRAIISEESIHDNSIIRINSHVTIEDVKANTQMKIQIVLPSLSDVKERKISILAPLSVAIIGFKQNDQVDWELPSGIKTLKIIQVNNTVPSHY